MLETDLDQQAHRQLAPVNVQKQLASEVDPVHTSDLLESSVSLESGAAWRIMAQKKTGAQGTRKRIAKSELVAGQPSGSISQPLSGDGSGEIGTVVPAVMPEESRSRADLRMLSAAGARATNKPRDRRRRVKRGIRLPFRTASDSLPRSREGLSW
jgi:hypothetical protein